MKNYQTAELGTMAAIAEREFGKAFLKDALGLTGCEISVNVVPQGFKMPFNHKHKQNEEVYLILKGEGVLTIDGDRIAVSEGSAVRVAPEAVRAIENTGGGELQFICVQAKENSLEQCTGDDGVIC